MNRTSTPQPANQGNWLPVISLLYSAAFWGILWYPLRLLENAGLSGLWQTLISYSAALAISLPWLRDYHRLLAQPLAFFLLALAAGWANLAFILAMLEGTVVRAMLLFYLAPVWTMLIGRWLLHETINSRIFVLMSMAMVGALLMLWDPNLHQPWPKSIADWLALSSGIAFALNNVLIRKLRFEPILLKTQVTWMGCVMIALIAIVIRGDVYPNVEEQVIWWTILLGIGGLMIANLTLQFGVTHMKAQKSAVILLFELVVGGVSAAMIAGELLSLREFIGGGIILVAGYLVAVWGHSDEQLAAS